MRASATKNAKNASWGSWHAIVERFLLPIPDRLRDGRFWTIQAMIAVITAFHISGEVSGFAENYGALRHFPVTLYVLPVIYAALRFGLEGGLLTGLWSFAASAPNLTIWHKDELEGEIGLLILVLGIGLILAWRVERESTLRRQAESAKADLQDSQERLQFYLRKVTEAQEAERQRVARELHDDTIQSLVLVGRDLESVITRLDERPNADAQHQVQEARTKLDATIDGVRRLARDLRPSILDRLGLVPSIEWLLDELAKRLSLNTKLEIEGELERLPSEVELGVFRIVQEALRNVELHADAKNVHITLASRDGLLEVRVRDDGKGFRRADVLARDLKAGLGLQGMQERAQILGGKAVVESQPGQGTTVTAMVSASGQT